MYYEYHLKDKSIELSDVPNLSLFPRVIDVFQGHDEDDYMPETFMIEILYCVVKHGDLIIDDDSV